MKSTRDIIVIGTLFMVIAWALSYFNFWSMIDMDIPKGLMIQGGMFIVLWFVLAEFLFVPFMKLSQERVAQTQGRKEEALSEQAQAQEMHQQYRNQLQESKIKAVQLREQLALAAEKEEKEILDQARDAAKESLQTSINELTKQRVQAQEDLTQSIPSIVEDIVAQTLSGKNKAAQSLATAETSPRS